MAFFLLWLQLTGLAWNTRIPADQVHCEAGQISLVVEEQILERRRTAAGLRDGKPGGTGQF